MRPDHPRSRSAHTVFLCILTLALCGCQGAVAWAGAPTPTDRPHGAALFADDFSRTPNGWGVSTSEAVSVSYERGGLRILVGVAQTDGWSVAGKKLGDVDISVTASRLGGPDNNLIGVICRYQNRQNFYTLFVTSDGYYGIGKYAEDSYQLLGAEQLQYTSVIRPERTQYELRAVCSGETLTLYLDGWKLMKVEDAGFGEGDVGVIAGAYQTPGVDVLFDDFVVSQP